MSVAVHTCLRNLQQLKHATANIYLAAARLVHALNTLCNCQDEHSQLHESLTNESLAIQSPDAELAFLAICSNKLWR